jgi:hypothetical protein
VGEDGPDFSDLHHLFPSEASVNSVRSALPFDESTNQQSSPFAPESFADSNSFEPLDRDKGVVARALLYMAVRYDGSDALTSDLQLADNTSPTGTHGVLSTLLAWHRAFPPTDFERARNSAIYSGVQVNGIAYAQGNRNPFIDFPQFVDGIFVGSSAQSFSKWQLQNFTLAQLLNDAVSGPNADGDGDGRTNYAEYLTGGNPKSGIDPLLTINRSGGNLVLSFLRPKGITEQTILQSSQTLGSTSWQAVANWQASASYLDMGDYEQVNVSFPASSAKFWRVVFQ